MTIPKRSSKALLVALVVLHPSIVQGQEKQEQQPRRVQLGGYHEAQVNDPFVVDASKCLWNTKIHLQDFPSIRSKPST
jgi:hypothetical protein